MQLYTKHENIASLANGFQARWRVREGARGRKEFNKGLHRLTLARVLGPEGEATKEELALAGHSGRGTGFSMVADKSFQHFRLPQSSWVSFLGKRVPSNSSP